MARTIALALTLGFFTHLTGAFTAPKASPTASSLHAAPLDGMVGASTEFGLNGEPWDPLGLSTVHDLIKDDVEHYGVFPSPQWLRESELKHGRMASEFVN